MNPFLTRDYRAVIAHRSRHDRFNNTDSIWAPSQFRATIPTYQLGQGRDTIPVLAVSSGELILFQGSRFVPV